MNSRGRQILDLTLTKASNIQNKINILQDVTLSSTNSIDVFAGSFMIEENVVVECEEGIDINDLNIEHITPDVDESNLGAKENVPEHVSPMCIIQNNNENTLEIKKSETMEDREPHNKLELTKRGNPRKRKKANPREKAPEKRKRLAQQHPVLPGCGGTTKCKLNCSAKISNEQRYNINKEFWTLDWFEQRSYILTLCSRENVKLRTKSALESQRNMTVTYKLKDGNGIDQVVCKSFFLTTLGYQKKNDGVVFRVLTSNRESTVPKRDKRGRHQSSRKIDHTNILQHIESFHPTSSHYRREHAPNVRYLPSDVTIEFMHQDFARKHPQMTVSYDLYRKIIKDANIHFTKLRHEECESCVIFEKHNSEHGKQNLDPNCGNCVAWSKHRDKYKEARQRYAINSETKYTNDTICFSVDLQKVIMLPRMESFKRVVFTKRLTVYNESFVPVGHNQKHIQPFAVIWHEGISGRNKEDIVSTFYAFFRHFRDKRHIKIWLDNCSAQNKNWCLLSFLVYIINSPEVQCESITLNYFVAGHTFMSADSFHHLVEKSLRKQKKTYDFRDFTEAVANCSRRVTVKTMEPEDFYHWKDHHAVKSSSTVLLADIVAIRAQRGMKESLLYKTDFDANFEELQFLKKSSLKAISQEPKTHTRPRGITQEVKDRILKKLCPLMKENRRTFWQNLPVSGSSNSIPKY